MMRREERPFGLAAETPDEEEDLECASPPEAHSNLNCFLELFRLASRPSQDSLSHRKESAIGHKYGT